MTEQEEAENKAWQQIRILEYLNYTPIIQFLEPYVEADDVIAAIAQQPSIADWQKVIISSDKDFIQLLDDKTLLYRPTQKQVLNKNIVIEKYWKTYGSGRGGGHISLSLSIYIYV